MYISGHLEILEDILDIVKVSPNEQKRLELGMEYIDLPCGVYSVEDKKIIMDPIICSPLDIMAVFKENISLDDKNIVLYQHHQGYMAHLHSMSTDPNNTNEYIRQKIIVSLVGYFIMAYKTNDYVWLGYILHAITDSYSPSHTLRSTSEKYKTVDVKSFRHEEHEKLKKLAKTNKIDKKLENSDYYKLLKLEYDLNKQAKMYVKFPEINKKYEVNRYTHGDIIGFQNITIQPFLLHNILDNLYFIRNNERMYIKMVKESCLVLIIFKEKSTVKVKINKFIDLLMSKTYKMTTKNLREKSNKTVIY